MSQASVFKSNKSQAIRLPKAVALPDHVQRVDVIRQGEARLLIPVGGGWQQFFDTPPIDDDFLQDRQQPAPQVRTTR